MKEKIRIAFFETEGWEKDYLIEKLGGFAPSFFSEPLSESNADLAKDCQIVSPFIYSKISGELFSKLPNLKMVATRSTGFDHIDVLSAKGRNMVICNVPSYGENTVAEHTFSLILSLSRNIFNSVERTKKGDFSLDGLRGFDLKGKTIGIVGLGNIGLCVAKIAKGFGMDILVYDIKKDNKAAKKLGFKYADLDELLSNSDIITLHAPYNEKTSHLININNISLIKRGAYLINTARGGLVETSALLKALSEGILAGAGLDVLEEECFVKEEAQLLSKEFPKQCDLKTILQNHILLQQKNVIITPHNAFNSEEAIKRILETTILNIQSFIKNKPINKVYA